MKEEISQAPCLTEEKGKGPGLIMAGSLSVAHYDIYQAARYIDDLLNGALANK
jgi:hypothetical protein